MSLVMLMIIAMLQIFSISQYYTLKEIISRAYITKPYDECNPPPLGTFVLKRNFTHVHFSDELKPLRIGPYKILARLSDVTYELLSQDGTTFHIHQDHLIPYYPKEPLLYPQLRIFCISQTLTIYTSQKNFNTLIVTLRLSRTLYHRLMKLPKTTHPTNHATPRNDTSSYRTVIQTHDTNPSHTRTRHFADNSSFPSLTNPS